MAHNEVIDGLILDEDQSDVPMPAPEDWQGRFNTLMRRGWSQAFEAKRRNPDITAMDNPYFINGRIPDDLTKQTLALAWEDGITSDAESLDECPFPES